MFNLSKIRQEAANEWFPPEEVDSALKQENEYHKGLMESVGREPAIQFLGNHYTMRSFGENPEAPEDVSLKGMMGEYFYYLKQYDKEFLKRLTTLVHNLQSRYKNDPEALKKVLSGPGAAPAPGGGAPGPGGPAPAQAPMAGPAPAQAPVMAAKTAGHSMYLNKDEGNYSLKNSLAGRLMRGDAHYLDAGGKTRRLIVSPGQSAPRTSNVISILNEINSGLPNGLSDRASKALSESGISDSDVYYSFLGPYFENGSFDFRPLSVLVGGPSFGFLVYYDAPGIKEPEVMSSMRKSMGEVMAEKIIKLKMAMDMDGIEYVDRAVRMPKYMSDPDDAGPDDRFPTREPHVLSADRAATSLDASSLVMTIASQRTDERAKLAALDRLIKVIAHFPNAYKTRKLSSQDIDSIARLGRCSDPSNPFCSKLEQLQQLVKLFDADDASVLRAFGDADDTQKNLIATLVAKQNRSDICRMNPQMAICGNRVNEHFMSLLDPKDKASADVVREAIRRHSTGEAMLNNPSLAKSMHVLYENGDEQMLQYALSTDSPLSDLATCLLVERGGDEDRAMAMNHLVSRGGRRNSDDLGKMLLVTALLKAIPDDEPVRQCCGSMNVSPSKLARVAGKDVATRMMRISRLGWSGQKLPGVNEIVGLTDDPLPLLKDYFELASHGDKESHAALRKMHGLLSSAESNDPYMAYAQKYVRDALSRLGDDVDILELMIPEPDTRPVVAQVLPTGHVLVRRAGRYEVVGTDVCFSSKASEAPAVALRLMTLRQGT